MLNLLRTTFRVRIVKDFETLTSLFIISCKYKKATLIKHQSRYYFHPIKIKGFQRYWMPACPVGR